MPRYPHTKLLSHPYRTVVLSGPHIQLLDLHGRILFSTANFSREDKEDVIRSGPIRCSGMSKDGRYLATAGDDKRLKVWDLESLTLLSARLLPKKPTSIEFSQDADILVADKFGDVFRYPLHPNNSLTKEKSIHDMLAPHENPSGGQLVLGHASLLTSFLLSPDQNFIITADRDEHIRVSWYPEGYVIESYCLGHKRYVSAIHIPAASPTNLISGGGDPELKVWDWMTGRLRRNISVFSGVEPFIRVRARNRKHDPLRDNSDDEKGVKLKDRGEDIERESQWQISSLELKESESHEALEGSNESSTTATVFIVYRISSFVSGGESHVVFNVVGATAIFEFVLTEIENQPNIRHYDFGKPVIDFTICGEGSVWVLLDADFTEELNVTEERSCKLVRTVQWSDGQFVDAGNSMLLESLNAICPLPATAEDVKTLDLYSDLLSLPKSIDVEQGDQILGGMKQVHQSPKHDSEATGESAFVAPGLTKRALGRLKHKRALDQLHREKAFSPGTKKTKADSENEASHGM